MYGIDQSGGVVALGTLDVSVLVAFALVFLFVYQDLADPLGLGDDVALGLRATSVSLLLVFVALAAVRAPAV